MVRFDISGGIDPLLKDSLRSISVSARKVFELKLHLIMDSFFN